MNTVIIAPFGLLVVVAVIVGLVMLVRALPPGSGPKVALGVGGVLVLLAMLFVGYSRPVSRNIRVSSPSPAHFDTFPATDFQQSATSAMPTFSYLLLMLVGLAVLWPNRPADASRWARAGWSWCCCYSCRFSIYRKARWWSDKWPSAKHRPPLDSFLMRRDLLKISKLLPRGSNSTHHATLELQRVVKPRSTNPSPRSLLQTRMPRSQKANPLGSPRGHKRATGCRSFPSRPSYSVPSPNVKKI